MSQIDIAKWSGRKSIQQNSAYDHESGRDILVKVRALVGKPGLTVGSLAIAPSAALISRDEFSRLKIPTAHTTEFGYCIHDFTMLPCQLHRDCTNCDEQLCIKGDASGETNIRRQRDETRVLLSLAKNALDEGDAGASRWVTHQEATLARLDDLCAILDDPKVPAGSIIQLSKLVPSSRITQSLASKASRDTGFDAMHGRLPHSVGGAKEH
jgi:hypothetical protein